MEAVTDRSMREKTTGLKRLVLFDFDGTITTRDTLAEIMIYFHGKTRYLLGLMILSPIMALYILRLIPNWKAKQFLLSWFFKGHDAAAFQRKCTDFSLKVIPMLVRKGAIEKIKEYKESGATIAVVTASAENWVKPWCDKMEILCLATKLEISDNKLTGKILGKNCHGSEKVCRITEQFDIQKFDEIIAFGDTSGDREMLAIAREKYYKPFRD